MKIKEGNLLPQPYTQSCRWMAVPHIIAGWHAFYPGMENSRESERSHLILLRVAQAHAGQSEDFQQLHSMVLMQTQV